MADLPVTRVQGRAYGASKPEPHAVDVLKGPKDTELKKIEAEKKKKKFSEMVNTYKEDGLKSFLESLDKKEEEIIDELSKDIADYTMDVIDAGDYAEVTIGEEATEDEFNKEVADAKAKNDGKKKNDEIATGAVQSVKNEETHTTVQVIDLDPINGIQHSEFDLEDIQEREMTEPETKKKEEIVKSMKKGIAGFKERYGDRAKNVMYATATKQAMK